MVRDETGLERKEVVWAHCGNADTVVHGIAKSPSIEIVEGKKETVTQ